MKKRVYSTEFKSEAVRLSYQRENIKELADELGVQVQRIYKWRAGQKTKASPKATIKLETDSIEVKRLRKALKKKLPTSDYWYSITIEEQKICWSFYIKTLRIFLKLIISKKYERTY